MSPAGRHMTCNYCLGLHSNSLLKNLSNMAGQSHNLKAMVHVNTDPIASYIWQNSVREPECLRKLREETESKLGRLSRMLVDPPEAQFLRLLVGTSGAKRYVARANLFEQWLCTCDQVNDILKFAKDELSFDDVW